MDQHVREAIHSQSHLYFIAELFELKNELPKKTTLLIIGGQIPISIGYYNSSLKYAVMCQPKIESAWPFLLSF